MNTIRDFSPQELRALLSMTKYPAIETFHAIGDRGRLTEQHTLPPDEVIVTEKVDGTNAGIVFRRGEFLIRSREEWLTYSTDVVRNPANRIDEALLPIARHLAERMSESPSLRALFGEVYGGNINAAKVYTSTAALGFRIFDALTIAEADADAMLTWPVEQVAGWRDHGGQTFATEEQLAELSEATGLRLTPRICNWNLTGPESLASMQQRTVAALDVTKGTTMCALDVNVAGPAEGVVLRTRDRRWIRKARFEDYRRTLGGKRNLPPDGPTNDNAAPAGTKGAP